MLLTQTAVYRFALPYTGIDLCSLVMYFSALVINVAAIIPSMSAYNQQQAEFSRVRWSQTSPIGRENRETGNRARGVYGLAGPGRAGSYGFCQGRRCQVRL